MEWRQFVMNLESLDPELVESVLLGCGALSVTFTDAGDEPVLEPLPGETPLWTHTSVTALFDAATDLDRLPGDLRAALELEKLPPSRIETLADREWEREWLRVFGPMQFGKHLRVAPHDADVPDGAVVVRLDPGLAFGTGTHPTTALCLEWLSRLALEGRSVFDFGCGSGILSIAALKLGARSATGVDIDLQAVTATRQNAMDNGVLEHLYAGTEMPPGSRQYDVVVANILAGTLVDCVSIITEAAVKGADIAMSGILEDQAGLVIEAYEHAVDFRPPALLDGWALVTGNRK
jgi:ribosomal protein L11 methyltransferase